MANDKDKVAGVSTERPADLLVAARERLTRADKIPPVEATDIYRASAHRQHAQVLIEMDIAESLRLFNRQMHFLIEVLTTPAPSATTTEEPAHDTATTASTTRGDANDPGPNADS